MISTMVIATQYAITKIGYEYTLVHPCEANIRFIGSDNSTDGIRVLRVSGDNVTNISLRLHLGENYSSNMVKTYTAAFGIVNEESHYLNITHINVTSLNTTYMKIWLHGNRTANANGSDPYSVYMYNNGTIVNASNTTAWRLAAGDGNTSLMCYNISDRTNCSINTTWDNTSHVRYSVNDSLAYGIGMFNRTEANASDFVWVQVTLDFPNVIESLGRYTGTIWIHFESEPD
jgi:hypothetical protein